MTNRELEALKNALAGKNTSQGEAILRKYLSSDEGERMIDKIGTMSTDEIVQLVRELPSDLSRLAPSKDAIEKIRRAIAGGAK